MNGEGRRSKVEHRITNVEFELKERLPLAHSFPDPSGFEFPNLETFRACSSRMV